MHYDLHIQQACISSESSSSSIDTADKTIAKKKYAQKKSGKISQNEQLLFREIFTNFTKQRARFVRGF
jgi:hypothetical protein